MGHQPIVLKILSHSARFWPKDFWPPSLPDLNPLNFNNWTEVEAKACATRPSNASDLKMPLAEEWTNLDFEFIISLERGIEAKGGHIE